MGKNKIMNSTISLAENDIVFGESMLFDDSPETGALSPKLISDNALKVKANIINESNFVDMGEKMLYSISDFSLFAQKLFYTTISAINKDDENFQESVFKVTDMVKYFKIDKRNAYNSLRQASNELYESEVFIWNKKRESLKATHLFQDIHFIDKGTISLTLSPAVKDHLLKLNNNFYKVPLEYLLQLPTVNAMRLFHILYGYLYYINNSYIIKNRNKIKDEIKLEIPYEKLRAMFESEKYKTLRKTGKLGKDKYPTFKDFKRNVLKPAIEAINKLGIINIELDTKRGEKQEIFENFYPVPVNPRKVSHIIFTISEGAKYVELEKGRKNKKAEDALLREICDFFKARFDINENVIKKLQKDGYSYMELMLAAISMQSILNLSSRGLWIYTEDKLNWNDLVFRKEHYIKEYKQIAIPNLGILYDKKDIFHQLIINEPVGFLKSTLKDNWYLSTIDLVNSPKADGSNKLASFCEKGNEMERLYTKSLYDNTEWGDKIQKYIRKKILPKEATAEDFDLIYQVFSFCRDGALKMNPNAKWKDYFWYESKDDVNLYWKLKFYPQYPDRRKAIKNRIDSILEERNLL